MSAAERVLASVEAECQRNRLWRAKEVLRGAIASGIVDPSVLLRYGQILNSVGERVEAGKFFFLAGVRTSETEDAIRLFLRRHSRHGTKELVSQFPTAIRRQEFDNLPESVRRDLVALGVERGGFGPRPHSKPQPSRWGWVMRAALVMAIVLFFVGIGMGLMTVVRWLREVIR